IKLFVVDISFCFFSLFKASTKKPSAPRGFPLSLLCLVTCAGKLTEPRNSLLPSVSLVLSIPSLQSFQGSGDAQIERQKNRSLILQLVRRKAMQNYCQFLNRPNFFATFFQKNFTPNDKPLTASNVAKIFFFNKMSGGAQDAENGRTGGTLLWGGRSMEGVWPRRSRGMANGLRHGEREATARRGLRHGEGLAAAGGRDGAAAWRTGTWVARRAVAWVAGLAWAHTPPALRATPSILEGEWLTPLRGEWLTPLMGGLLTPLRRRH
ncbi:MAG: hypothetical protein IKQ89_00080, partial [Muribaculaceae bacterium]|nr:hypothetical protein [Muribaculaceae bacterium]